MKIAIAIVLALFLIVPAPMQMAFGQTIVESTNYDQYTKCVGVGCKNILLGNGTITATPQNTPLIVYMFKQNFPTSSQLQQQQTQDEVEDEGEGGFEDEDDGGSIGDGAIKCNDPNWNGEGTCIDPSVPKCQADTDEVCYTSDGDLKNLDKQPYCDEVDSSEDCWDRKDYDQETGLYPCKDGSYVEDWRDCDDDRDDEGSDGGDEENSDEETENCGGEPCTATEKEDSWVDDETEYYEEEPECRENNDGALGDPIPCE